MLASVLALAGDSTITSRLPAAFAMDSFGLAPRLGPGCYTQRPAARNRPNGAPRRLSVAERSSPGCPGNSRCAPGPAVNHEKLLIEYDLEIGRASCRER